MSQALATGTPNPGVIGSIPIVRAKKCQMKTGRRSTEKPTGTNKSNLTFKPGL